MISYQENLLRLFELTPENIRAEGVQWYPSARLYFTQLARKYKLQPRIVLGVVAALSPFVSWKTQLLHTEGFIRNELKKKGSGRFPGFKPNIRNARNIMAGMPPLEVLKGPKTRAFYKNLIGLTNHVTLDRHAISAALNVKVIDHDDLKGIAMAYRKAARKVGLGLSHFQAVIWQMWRLSC